MVALLRIWRPTPLKLALALGAFATSAFARYEIQAARIVDLWSWGFPLAFYETWGPCAPGMTCRAWTPAPLLVDLLFWYVVTVLLLTGLGALRWMAADIGREG
jgi:hypothetical protein